MSLSLGHITRTLVIKSPNVEIGSSRADPHLNLNLKELKMVLASAACHFRFNKGKVIY